MIRRVVTVLAALAALEALTLTGPSSALTYALWTAAVAVLTPAIFLSIRDLLIKIGGAS